MGSQQNLPGLTETAMTDGMMNVCLQRHSEFREES